MFKHNVAKTIGFTTFPNIVLLKPLVYSISKHNVAKIIGCTFSKKKKKKKHKQLQTKWTVDITKNNIAETNEFSNIVFVNVVEPLVSAAILSNTL